MSHDEKLRVKRFSVDSQQKVKSQETFAHLLSNYFCGKFSAR